MYKLKNNNTHIAYSIRFLFLLIILNLSVLATESEATKKANIILKNTKNVIEKKVKISDIKNMSLNSEFVYSYVDTVTKPAKLDYKFLSPDKLWIRRIEFYESNNSDSTIVINGNNYSDDVQILIDGKVAMTGPPPNSVASTQNNKEKRLKHLRQTFYDIFPIVLDTSFFPDFKLEFKFIGIAQAPDGRANIIEATSEDNIKYRLFFDEKTNLLLMMTLDWTSNKTGKEYKRTLFYSDYKENGGLLIAHKVIVEQEGKRIREKVIKKFIANSKIEEKLFEIKGTEIFD